MSKKTAKKPTTAKTVKTEAPAEIALTKICEAEGRDPKAVRARFRKIWDKPGFDETAYPRLVNGRSGGWTFLKSDEEAVSEMVRNVKPSGSTD